MKRSLFCGLAVLLTLSLYSCREEEPEINIIPDPVIDTIGDRSLELWASDTLFVSIDEPVALRFSTTPWNLPALDSATVGVCDADFHSYEFAKAGQPEMLADSSWTVSVRFNGGARRGDVVRFSLEHTDTVMYSKPFVLEVISSERFIEVMGSDTITFNEGEYPVMRLYTNPWNLLVPDSVPLNVYTAGDSLYPYASVVRRTLEKDNTWTVTVRLEYGMKDGDIIRLGVPDSASVLYSQPVLLDQIAAHEVSAFIMQRLSGRTSAYENGGSAHIRIRTNPWNLFLDYDAELAVTDTLGAASNSLSVSEMEFQPDSTWIISATLAKNSYAFCRLAAVKDGDTLCLSDIVDVRKISISLSSVKVAGTALSKSSDNYSGLFATVTDFSAMELAVSSTADSVTCGGVRIDGTAVLDLSQPIVLTAHKFDISHDFKVKVRNTGLPVVRITTPNAKSISSKTTWVGGCTIRIELPDGTVDLVDTLEMRGRGNNTWTYNKKPYALRMDGRTKVLGMPKHKRWILLANYKDRTLMRNDATFWLSKQSGLNYTINGQFVELVMNGKHVGNYYLCEQAKIDKHRINIAEPNPLDPETSGYLVEIDMYYDDDKQELKNRGEKTTYFGFHSSKFNIPYQFKQPDRDEMTQGAFDFFKGVVNDFEAVLKDETKVKNHEYEKYIDVDQAIDYMLVNELAGNHDFYNTYPSAGPHSTYIYYDAANERKLTYGPGWDFDYHTYMPSRASNWIGLTAHQEQQQDPWGGGWGWNWGGGSQNADYYYYFMLKDPKFMNRVIERWDMQKDKFKELPAYIDSMTNYLRDSESANYKVWGAINNQNGDENEDKDLSFQAAIDKMKKGFNQRWEWIDTNIRKIKL